ncbi:hypothetical protein [Pseudomonas aeruginosa]|uniref:hypothetical protein n=2 Tax=Pseudomonas aeruginosa TaxID=287 RepID=UPI00244CBF87|nr:hypothetical protein [Pseudomonas aeruginosa]MDH1421295.1 hypothetical protein [Pseudomonas aeruginosa]
MYIYKRAVGINQIFPRGEELVDISEMTTKELVATFCELKIVVKDGLYGRDVVIDLADYHNQFLLFDGVIQQWLDTQINVPLKTSNTLPGSEYRYVTAQDIQYKWFTLYPGDAKIANDRQEHLDVASAPDIRVIKTDRTAVDYNALVERGLWTINGGHLVRAVADDQAVYLLNGGKHFNVNDNIHVNYLNFNTLSKLKTYTFQETDIDFEDHDSYNFLHVRSPVSLRNKTVWMSIGGRLYLNDVVQVMSDRTLTLRTEKVDWFSALFISKSMIDLSRIIDPEREVVDKRFFSTESFWKTLLTDPSTFLIVLDNPNLYVSVEPITTYQYPFTYHTHETRPIPLMVSNGLIPKYFTRKIINRRLLDIDLGIQRKFLNKTTGITNGGNLYHGYTNRFEPSSLYNGYHLYIRSVIQED